MPDHPCARCGAPATLFLTQVAGEAASSLALCAACAAQGITAAPLPAAAAGLCLPIPLPASRTPCPSCGFRWPDFERHQRLGCPDCYGAHAAQSRALVARTQPALAHQGRRPGTPVAPLQRELEELTSAPSRAAAPDRRELESRLAEAIRAENYEEAARLRDLLASRKPGD